MPKRFQRWGLLAVLLLLGSSAVGLVVRGVVKPKSEYYNNFGYTRPVTVTPTVQYRTDLTIGPQPFNPPAKAAPLEQSEFAAKIEAFQNDQARGAFVQNHFDAERMAEEWVRFGASQFRNQTPTSATLQADEAMISSHIGPGAVIAPGVKPSKVEILSVARSMVGQDCWVLAKHTASKNGVKHSWQARWWFTQKYGQARLYDFEPQPHRLRFNALLAGMETARYRGLESKRLGVEVRQRFVLDLCDEFARSLSREADGYEALPGGGGFQAEIEYLPPLEGARKYVEYLKKRKEKQGGIRFAYPDVASLWPDSPVAWFAGARIDKSNVFRSHPWSVVLESRTQKTGAVPQLLRSALDQSPGQPDLLVELSRHLPAGERAEIGERAAKAVDPAASLRAVFESNSDRETGRVVIDAYRALRPEDENGLAIDAALQTQAGKLGEATRLLQAALESPRTRDLVAAEYAAMIERLNCVEDGLKVSAKLTPLVFQFVLHDREASAADRMLALIAQDLGSDPWHQYHSARRLMRQEKYEDALKILSDLLRTLKTVEPLPPATPPMKPRSRFEELLRLPHAELPAAHVLFETAQAECLNKLNRVAEAKFLVAAGVLIQDGKYQELRDLMQSQPARTDDDYWRGRLAVAEERDSDAIRHFSQYTTESVAASLTPKDARILVDGIIRAYLRTNTLQQAKQTLDWYYDGSEPMLKLMIATNLHHNRISDAKKFLAIYLAKAGDKAGREALMQDPDLGPLLNLPKFQNFLK